MGKDRRRRPKGFKACKAKLVENAAFAASVVAWVKSGSKNKSGASGSKVPASKKSRTGIPKPRNSLPVASTQPRVSKAVVGGKKPVSLNRHPINPKPKNKKRTRNCLLLLIKLL